MGIRYRSIRVPDLHDYDPEFNDDGTERHIVCDGARYHVLSYSMAVDAMGRRYVYTRCSEPNCEINKINAALTEGKP